MTKSIAYNIWICTNTKFKVANWQNPNPTIAQIQKSKAYNICFCINTIANWQNWKPTIIVCAQIQNSKLQIDKIQSLQYLLLHKRKIHSVISYCIGGKQTIYIKTTNLQIPNVGNKPIQSEFRIFSIWPAVDSLHGNTGTESPVLCLCINLSAS